MKKRLLPFMLILLAFIGGFISGAIHNSHKADLTYRISHAPQSSKNPEIKAKPLATKQEQKVLMGYVQDFRNPDEIDYENLTHAIFSFAHPTADGGLLLNGDHALKNLRSIVSKAKQHDTKVMLAIGGWFHISGGESYAYFKKAISSTTARKKLVNEIMILAEEEKIDGVDIDFEHPRSTEDARYLAAFAKELNARLHPKGKELSIAVNAKVHSVTGEEIHSVVFEPSMFQYFDHVNLMAYDGHWDGEYNASNLSPYSYSQNVLGYWTALFDEYGFSRKKLVLGVPLYAQPENPAGKQVSYEALIKNNPANARKDSVSMNGTTYHYNGHPTLQKKTRLAMDHQIGGMMLWEAGLDAQGPHSAAGLVAKVLKKTGDIRFYTLK